MALSTEVGKLALEIRRLSIAAIFRAGSGHPGGALSAADIMAVLFTNELQWTPSQRDVRDRHRFVLSKGHACPALYALLAATGLCPRADVFRLRQLNSPMQGHPHVGALPWVDTSTGSLGQGFSVALGMAMGLRMQNRAARAYALLGDGELQEGQVWEAAMAGAHHGVSNLCAIVDYNKLQSDAEISHVMRIEPLCEKWRAFGWNVLEVDGHDVESLTLVFSNARAVKTVPTVVIAHTIKGQGVSFMENVPAWHGSVRLRVSEAVAALRELDCSAGYIAELLGMDIPAVDETASGVP